VSGTPLSYATAIYLCSHPVDYELLQLMSEAQAKASQFLTGRQSFRGLCCVSGESLQLLVVARNLVNVEACTSGQGSRCGDFCKSEPVMRNPARAEPPARHPRSAAKWSVLLWQLEPRPLRTSV
jgi:hypothetical protein